jgi:hypothetical protein
MCSLTRHPSPQLPKEAFDGLVSLNGAIEAAADQWPHLVAVESDSISMTYQDLDEDSTSTANHLVNLVKQGEIAGILNKGLLQGTLGALSAIKLTLSVLRSMSHFLFLECGTPSKMPKSGSASYLPVDMREIFISSSWIL